MITPHFFNTDEGDKNIEAVAKNLHSQYSHTTWKSGAIQAVLLQRKQHLSSAPVSFGLTCTTEVNKILQCFIKCIQKHEGVR